ncbi:MAG: hypothetical protein AB1696_18330 [Planctomycetota bacterium]
MTDQTRTPWPRSWPPFWRGALHVAIATGVGNVTIAVGRTLAFCSRRMYNIERPFLIDPVDFHLLTCVAPMLSVLVLLIIVRPGKRVVLGLLTPFLLGIPLAVLAAVGPLVCGRLCFLLIPFHLLLFPPWGIVVGFGLVGVIFAKICRQVPVERVAQALTTGGLVFVLGFIWQFI